MNDVATMAQPPAAEVSRIRDLLRRREFSQALDAAQALLAEAPDHRDGQLFAAMAQRYLGRVSEALETLSKLERLYPRFSRVYEERGHCFVLMKHAPQAIEAFSLAVDFNHALPASWSMLEGLHRMTGQAELAAMAGSQLAILRKLPPAVVTATALFLDGDLDAAEPLVRAYLLQNGDEIEAMRLLARIGIARKVYDDAEILLAAVIQLAPDYLVARAEHTEALIELHRYSEARIELETLLRDDPTHRHYYQSLYATTLVGLGEHELAVRMYRELLRASPADADLYLSVAHALKTLGRSDEAIDAYRKAAALRPAFGDAYWSLANLKTYKFSDDEFGALAAYQTVQNLARVDRYHLHFAFGKALEDRGEYAAAFQYYGMGNALKRAESNYRPEIIENNTRLQIDVCTSGFFAARKDWGAQNTDPIFIVGLPRSGSTLLEQILASHSLVEGTQELPNIQQIVNGLRGRDPDLDDPRYPRILREMGAADFRQLGEQYLAGTRVYRSEGPNAAPFFIDKMPNNFRHLGLIRLMLPRAKIIDARRDPMACCFSNLKQLFAKGQEFTYSIDDIARYYRTYLELMRHWDSVLPGWILRVKHENVVDDLEGNVRRILEFCGLPFEPQCIEFHKTSRSVRTASSEQVRQPIYRQGVDQWRQFEGWLGPLKEALGDAVDPERHE